jgi:hypothetical protein
LRAAKFDGNIIAHAAKIGVYASGLISKGIATIVHAWAAGSTGNIVPFG